MYQLKATIPDFRVVDGPYSGRLYRSGQQYNEIPPQEAHKFEQVPEAAEQPAETMQEEDVNNV